MKVGLRKVFAVGALVANFAGSALLLASFQAGPSDFRLMTKANSDVQGIWAPTNAYAICASDKTLASIDGGSRVLLGRTGVDQPCAKWQDATRAAVVTANSPQLQYVGFGLNVLGFFIQILLEFLPAGRTAASLQEQIRTLRKQAKLQQQLARIAKKE